MQCLVRELQLTPAVPSEAVQATTPRDAALFWIAAAVLVLNLFDAILTLIAVHAGAATEANPLMATSLGWGGVWFILFKVALVSLGVLLLWRTRTRVLAAGGLVAVCLLYLGLLIYHASALDLVTGHLTRL